MDAFCGRPLIPAGRLYEATEQSVAQCPSFPHLKHEDAVFTPCYIINKAFLIPIFDKTPYELYKGRKPNILYFRVFGCKYFILKNLNDYPGKFDEKVDEGFFFLDILL